MPQLVSQFIQQFLARMNEFLVVSHRGLLKSASSWHPSIRAPAKPQGVVGVIGIGGAAIRARYGVGVQTMVLMQTSIVRKPSLCARC